MVADLLPLQAGELLQNTANLLLCILRKYPGNAFVSAFLWQKGIETKPPVFAGPLYESIRAELPFLAIRLFQRIFRNPPEIGGFSNVIQLGLNRQPSC